MLRAGTPSELCSRRALESDFASWPLLRPLPPGDPTTGGAMEDVDLRGVDAAVVAVACVREFSPASVSADARDCAVLEPGAASFFEDLWRPLRVFFVGVCIPFRDGDMAESPSTPSGSGARLASTRDKASVAATTLRVTSGSPAVRAAPVSSMQGPGAAKTLPRWGDAACASSVRRANPRGGRGLAPEELAMLGAGDPCMVNACLSKSALCCRQCGHLQCGMQLTRPQRKCCCEGQVNSPEKKTRPDAKGNAVL